MTVSDVMKFIKENKIESIDFKFMDFPGLWQHFTIPVQAFDEDIFEEGLGFDGSSIRGWKTIDESDMIVIPDPATAMMDPLLHPVRPSRWSATWPIPGPKSRMSVVPGRSPKRPRLI